MTTRLHIGAKDLRGELAAYAKRFDLFEVRGLAAESLRQAPNAATLRRWRKAVPPQFVFSVVAGPALSRLKEGEAYDAELAAMLETARVLEASVLLVATSSDVTPGRVWRDRLAALVDRLPRDASTVVWEPSGLWELDDAALLAKKLGVTLAVDPARDPVPPGPVSYGRLRALGGTRAFSATALQKIALAIGERRDAYVVFETAGALKEAKQLRALVRGLKAHKRGGLGTIVRPRGATIRARDDEQEE